MHVSLIKHFILCLDFLPTTIMHFVDFYFLTDWSYMLEIKEKPKIGTST
jgi:hypothetical protein